MCIHYTTYFSDALHVWQIDLPPSSCQTHQYNTAPNQQLVEPQPLISCKQQCVYDMRKIMLKYLVVL